VKRRDETWAILAAVLGLAACGEHTYVNLDKVDTARLPDGRVRVTATVGCEQVGSTPCKSVGDYCVLVAWGDASAATDRQCVKTTLKKDSEQVVEVISRTSPPPGARAVITLVGAGGGPVIHIGTRGSPTTVDVP
jgi:hypothetical protein